MFIPKGYLQINLAYRIRRLTRHHSMENSIGRLKIFVSQPHATGSIIVKDINAATPIHEYLSEFVSTNLRRHHQSQVTRIINPGWVILSTP